MKKALLLSIITVSTFVISGCSSSQDTPQPQITTYTLDSEFSEKFDVCKKDPTSCNLDRDAVIE